MEYNKINIIKGDSVIVQYGKDLKDETKRSKSAFGIDKVSNNKVVTIHLDGRLAFTRNMSDVTIQDGKDGAPEQLTPDNWSALTEGLNDSKGGVGGDGDMKKSVYDTNNNNIVDDSERLGGLTHDKYDKILLIGSNDGFNLNDIRDHTEDISQKTLYIDTAIIPVLSPPLQINCVGKNDKGESIQIVIGYGEGDVVHVMTNNLTSGDINEDILYTVEDGWLTDHFDLNILFDGSTLTELKATFSLFPESATWGRIGPLVLRVDNRYLYDKIQENGSNYTFKKTYRHDIGFRYSSGTLFYVVCFSFFTERANAYTVNDISTISDTLYKKGLSTGNYLMASGIRSDLSDNTQKTVISVTGRYDSGNGLYVYFSDNTNESIRYAAAITDLVTPVITDVE